LLVGRNSPGVIGRLGAPPFARCPQLGQLHALGEVVGGEMVDLRAQRGELFVRQLGLRCRHRTPGEADEGGRDGGDRRDPGSDGCGSDYGSVHLRVSHSACD